MYDTLDPSVVRCARGPNPQNEVVSDSGIAERADKVVRIIVDTYVLPNKSFQEVRAGSIPPNNRASSS